MKKYLYTFAVAAALLLAACTPDPISEEAAFLTDDQAKQLVAEDGGKVYELNEFMDKFMTECGTFFPVRERSYSYAGGKYQMDLNNPTANNQGLFSIDTIPSAGPGIYIRGRIVTDDLGGNFYKSIVIQQVVGGVQQALRISVDGSSVSGMYPLGQEILIRCNGLAIGKYAGQPQLCVPSYNDNTTAMNASQKVGWAPGRIPWGRFQLATKRIGKPDASKIQCDVVKITDFQSLSSTKDFQEWDGRLVRLEGVYFTGQYENNGTLADCSNGDPEKDGNANVFAPTTENIGYPQSRVVTDGTEVTLVSNSEYAKFAYFFLPAPEYKGSVTGILGIYRDNARYDHDKFDWSITLRDIRTSSRVSIVNDLELKNASGQAWQPKEYTSK